MSADPTSVPAVPGSERGGRPVGLLLAWIALLFAAHRAVLGFRGRSLASDPIESFFFEAGATVPVVSYAAFLFVVWSRRQALSVPAARDRAPWTGGAVAMLGVLLFAWARLVAQLDLLIDSLVLSLAGGALFIGGWRRLERFLLPLALLWLARPWPPMTIHVLQEEFQTLAGTLASAILSPVGTIVRSGHLLAYDGRLFQVIEGCSGLRSTVTLVFATLLYADLFSRSRRQTLGLVGLAGVLGIGLNGLRVVWIMQAPDAEAAQDHSVQGLVVISIGILLVAGADALGDRLVWPAGSRAWRRPASPDPLTSRSTDSAWSVPLAVAALLGLASLPDVGLPRPELEAWRLDQFPSVMGTWRRHGSLRLDDEHLGSVGFRDKFYREYRSGSERILLFVGTDDRSQRHQSALSPKTAVVGSGWEIVESTGIRIPGFDGPVERSLQARDDERALVVHFRIGFDGWARESLRWLVAWDLRPDRRPLERAVFRVVASIEDGRRTQAQQRLDRFMRELVSAIERADPRTAP